MTHRPQEEVPLVLLQRETGSANLHGLRLHSLRYSHGKTGLRRSLETSSSSTQPSRPSRLQRSSCCGGPEFDNPWSRFRRPPVESGPREAWKEASFCWCDSEFTENHEELDN